MSSSTTPLWRRRLASSLGALVFSTVAVIGAGATPAHAAACDLPDSTRRVTHLRACDSVYGYRYYATNVRHNGIYWYCDWVAYEVTMATGNEYRNASHDRSNYVCGMSTRNGIVSRAQSELANKANRQDGTLDGCNFYTGAIRYTNSACGHSGTWGRDAWCADFVKWVWQQSGASVTSLNGLAGSFHSRGTTTSPQTWHANGSGYLPRPGDAVIYDWNSPYSPTSWTSEPPNTNHPVNHVGIVISYSTSGNGTLVTIEGNTSPPAGVSGPPGLWQKTRTNVNADGQVLGFIAPM